MFSLQILSFSALNRLYSQGRMYFPKTLIGGCTLRGSHIIRALRAICTTLAMCAHVKLLAVFALASSFCNSPVA